MRNTTFVLQMFILVILQYCVITNQSRRSHLVGDENLTSMNILIVGVQLTVLLLTSTRQMNLFKNIKSIY